MSSDDALSKGLVYVWTPDRDRAPGGSLARALVDLGPLALDSQGRRTLANTRVKVRNGGRRYTYNAAKQTHEEVWIGNAAPDCEGNFIFEPGKGGGRLDKYPFGPEDFQQRYMQASHFGEVNTFFHLGRVAARIGRLLAELNEPELPQVQAVVNAHQGLPSTDGIADGVLRYGHLCHPFQGGHYRLPAKRNSIVEHFPLAETGEIHLGPGRKLLDGGALVELAGSAYRANASHNAGIIYHEYIHHVARHTADFKCNNSRNPLRQNNVKPAIEEGICDYFAAAMLGTPHIWALHKRHDDEHRHPRSLASAKTMDDYDATVEADPHNNGTIWGAALWQMRCRMQGQSQGGGEAADRLVLKALVLTGRKHAENGTRRATCELRADYQEGLSTLLEADRLLYDSQFASLIRSTFLERKIGPSGEAQGNALAATSSIKLRGGMKRLPPAEIPRTSDILDGEGLDRVLPRGLCYDFIGVGDIMTGDRTGTASQLRGEDYPFAAVQPLLTRSAIVCGNLEGPLAQHAERKERNFSYRVDPGAAHVLKRAGINVLNLANNHLTDCGRSGVTETIAALSSAGIMAIGAGLDELAAHRPAVIEAQSMRIGMLGYYWNKRTAATASQPGSAMGTDEWLEADISALRKEMDRVVVVFHWGVPYEREPSREDENKARRAVELGADLVIGHHPHVVQKFDVYRGVPIFYSVGNFAFGSGNSNAEGLMVAVKFSDDRTAVDIYPLYVKNRDPRVDYQPKVLTGSAARRVLQRMAEYSGDASRLLAIEKDVGRLRIPRTSVTEAAECR